MPNTLKTVPKELRLMIFEELLGGEEWNGKTPNVIKALRTERDHEVYYEVLTIFHRMNHSYILSERNDWGFIDMSKEMIATIGRVTIEIRYAEPSVEDTASRIVTDKDRLSAALHPCSNKQNVIHSRLHSQFSNPPAQPNFHQRVTAKCNQLFMRESRSAINRLKLTASVAALRNVREVILQYGPGTIKLTRVLLVFDFLIGFSRLRKVTLRCLSAHSVDLFILATYRIVKGGNRILGVEGKSARHELCGWSASRHPAWSHLPLYNEEMIWEAKKGQSLTPPPKPYQWRIYIFS
jgi:hypothetical protein